MKTTILLLLSALFFLVLSCSESTEKTPIYLNPELSVEKRTENLLAMMTLREKVGQMNQYVGPDRVQEWFDKRGLNTGDNQSDFYTPLDSIRQRVRTGEIGSFLFVSGPEEANELQKLAEESRLKIPLLIAIDAIHGHAMFPYGGTIYPTSIGLSCSWDTALARQIALFTADELVATGFNWSFFPTADILRDPRWGRTGETFGEDPFLVSKMTNAFVYGLQKHDPPVLACSKAYVGGSQPLNGLNIAPTDISQRTLYEVFLPPYRENIDAGVGSVMAAHHEMDGIPMHANHNLLTQVLKEEMGFKGIVVSDWHDIFRLNSYHHVAEDIRQSVEKAVLAGIDIHMHGPGFFEPLIELVEEGVVPEEVIDNAVRKILKIKFEYGLFERRYVDTASWENKVLTKEHIALSLKAAEESIVLLKNENNVLPLSESDRSIFVTGPNADNHALLGDWSLDLHPDKVTTVLEGIIEKAGKNSKIEYFDCGEITMITDAAIQTAAKKAINSDIIIAVVGGTALRVEKNIRTYGENVDRASINLAGKQLELVQALKNTGKTVIIVYITGRPTSEPWIEENIPGILYAWEPGMRGGEAIANILFGHTNPSGKLTTTFPQTSGHIPVWYYHKPTMYTRKYHHEKTNPLYEFGYGLSYTQFSISEPAITNEEIKKGDSFTVTVNVSNEGKLAGEEVIQLYIRDDYASVVRPVKQLMAFKKIGLKPGENREVVFNLNSDVLKFYDANMNLISEPGNFTLYTGNSSRDSDLKSTAFKLIE